MMSLACEFSISAEDHLAARRRNRSGADAGGDDVGGAGAAMHEIVGQVHHFAEAMIHHRKAAVGAKHAQAVRHVVQRGVELAGQRRLALARHQRLHEYSVQIGRNLHDGHKKCGAHDRHRHVIGRATERQRDHCRTADERDLQLEYPLPSVGPARTSRHDPGGDGQTDHMGDGVVGDQQSGGAPYADRSGLDHRPDLMALLPPRRFIGRQGRFARLVPLQVERAERRRRRREARHTPRSEVLPSSARSWRPRWPEDETRQASGREFRTANRSAPREDTATSSGRVLPV